MISAQKVRKPPSVVNYYVAIAVDIVLLYVLNNLQYFNLSFIAENYISVLWAVNLALGFGIVGNFVLLLYRPRWFHHLVQAVLCALAVFAVYIIYRIFPFEFDSGNFSSALRIVLIIIMAGLGIGLLTEFAVLIKSLFQKKASPSSSTSGPSTPPTP